VAFAADIYGVDTPTATFQDWMAASGSHRSNATMYMSKMHGALTKMLEYDFVHPDKLAALGYCFGGTGMVNLAMAGYDGVQGLPFPAGLLGVVSFHGGLSAGYHPPQNGTRPKLLLHSGGKDDDNDAISTLTDDLESLGAVYEIVRYGPEVYHSFTEWSSNSPGAAMYDPLVDKRSWASTGRFFTELFATGVSPRTKPNMSAAPTYMHAERVPYVAGGVDCEGYLVYNSAKCTGANRCPAVMIVQDWNGMNDYEMERAHMLAQAGYVAFAADIYGVDTPTATFQDWMAASGSHRSNATMYMSKMHGALTKMLEYDFVHPDKLAALGYCFGGTGMVNLAMAGYDGVQGLPFPAGLLGVVSFHGGLSAGYHPPQNGTRPKLLLHSGGKDDDNDAISTLTDDLESLGAVYEIVRYGPEVYHSFTEWSSNSPGAAMYDPRADFRSWSSTMDFFQELFSTSVVCDAGSSSGSYSCGEIRDAYRSSGCCGMPARSFVFPSA